MEKKEMNEKRLLAKLAPAARDGSFFEGKRLREYFPEYFVREGALAVRDVWKM